MTEPFLFVNTYRLTPDADAEEYFRHGQEVVDLVYQNLPQMLHFGMYAEEGTGRVATVQVHAEPENLAKHLQLVGPHIKAVMPMLDWSSMQLTCFGDLSPTAEEMMRQMGVDASSLSVLTRRLGFTRLT